MKKKTDVISIRVDEDIKYKLSEESSAKNLTLNSLISQIVSKHVERGSLYDDVGFVSVGKSFLQSVLSKVSDPELEQIVITSCKETFKDTTIYLHGDYTIRSVIDTLDSWFDVSNIPFRKIEKSGFTRFVIRHELGSKCTLYFEILIKSILDDFDIAAKNFVKTTYSLSFQLNKY